MDLEHLKKLHEMFNIEKSTGDDVDTWANAVKNNDGYLEGLFKQIDYGEDYSIDDWEFAVWGIEKPDNPDEDNDPRKLDLGFQQTEGGPTLEENIRHAFEKKGKRVDFKGKSRYLKEELMNILPEGYTVEQSVKGRHFIDISGPNDVTKRFKVAGRNENTVDDVLDWLKTAEENRRENIKAE